MARECYHHTRAGLVTNVDPGLWPNGANAVPSFESRAVCAREACIADAIQRVEANTKSTAAFYPDPQRVGASR